jgi:hypothetical protein
MTGDEIHRLQGGRRGPVPLHTGSLGRGLIKAFEADLSFDTGAYVESQMIVLILTAAYIHTLYKLESTRYTGKLIHTNNIPYYFHHGGGIAQMAFGLGLHMDALARELGMDPVDFHLRNAVTKGHTNMTGTFFGSCGLKECITKVTKKAGWKRKYGKLPPLKGIGLGIGAMASGAKGVFKHDTSAALSDPGRRHHVMFMACRTQRAPTYGDHRRRVLGAQPADITVIAGDTDATPWTWAPSPGGAFNTGNAVRAACLDARQQIAVTRPSGRQACPPGIPRRHDLRRASPGNPCRSGRRSTTPCTAGAAVWAGALTRRGDRHHSLLLRRPSPGDGGRSPGWSCGPVIAAHDVGRAINHRGRPDRRPDLQWHVPGALRGSSGGRAGDEPVPAGLQTAALRNAGGRAHHRPAIDPFGPFGAKEVGEGPIVCTLPAIANAVANALGVPVNEMPITPWQILRILGRRGPAGD